MFKNLFKKSDQLKSNDSNTSTNDNVKLSPQLKELVEKSPLSIMTHQIFMHYLSDNLKEEPNNPSWQNQAIYFWSNDEPFEKKSLPDEFENFPVYHFIINELPSEVSLSEGEVIPWFGKPGKGLKYSLIYQNTPIPLNTLKEKGIIRDVKVIKLTNQNSNVLQMKGEYFFIMDEKELQFTNGRFFYNAIEILFSDAFEKGLLTLVKIS